MKAIPVEHILGSVNMLAFFISKEQTLTSLYGGLAKQLLLDPEELIGQAVSRIAQLPIKKNHLRRAFSGETFAITLNIQGISYETQLTPFREGDEIVGVVGLTLDMTKQIAMEQYFDEERHKMLASQRLNSLAGVTSGLAHEINNPLAIISGYAQQLMDQVVSGQLNPDRILFITEKLVHTSHRCHRIIEGLKSFARDGSLDPFEECSVNTLIEDSLLLCQGRFETLNVKLSWTPLAPDLMIEGRRLQLMQSLFNLLTNACEASAGLEDAHVQILIETLEQDMLFHIEDNGTGVPDSLQVKVFEPFFTTKGENRAVGIGLSSTKGIVEEHLGSLSFVSRPGCTRFTIRLPQKHPASGAA